MIFIASEMSCEMFSRVDLYSLERGDEAENELPRPILKGSTSGSCETAFLSVCEYTAPKPNVKNINAQIKFLFITRKASDNALKPDKLLQLFCKYYKNFSTRSKSRKRKNFKFYCCSITVLICA